MTRNERAPLESRLTDALRPVAATAPMPQHLLDISDGTVRAQSRAATGRGVLGSALVAVTIVAVIVAVGAAAQLGRTEPSGGTGPEVPGVAVPIESLDVVPRLTDVPEFGEPAAGPIVEVARGRAGSSSFSFVVYRGHPPSDVCVIEYLRPESSAGCGALPGQAPRGDAFGMGLSTHGAGDVHSVSGVVARDVAEVWVETDSGRARAELVPLEATGIDGHLFIAFLPGGVESVAWVAVARDGTVIERLETSPGPRQVPGPMPTPAAAP